MSDDDKLLRDDKENSDILRTLDFIKALRKLVANPNPTPDEIYDVADLAWTLEHEFNKDNAEKLESAAYEKQPRRNEIIKEVAKEYDVF